MDRREFMRGMAVVAAGLGMSGGAGVAAAGAPCVNADGRYAGAVTICRPAKLTAGGPIRAGQLVAYGPGGKVYAVGDNGLLIAQ